MIFDNLPDIVRLGTGLWSAGAPENFLSSPRSAANGPGFEDIAHDPAAGRLLRADRGAARAGRATWPRSSEYDGSLRYRGSDWLDFPLDGPNKGLEGLTCSTERPDLPARPVRGQPVQGRPGGAAAGGGRIQVFERGGPRGSWDRTGTIRLPRALGSRTTAASRSPVTALAVVSQASSALWVGRLTDRRARELADEGTVCRFPPTPAGRTVYRTVEGVSWLGDDRVVVVSDKVKPGSEERSGRAKDQSIHVFTIPPRRRVRAVTASSPAAARTVPAAASAGDAALLELARLRFAQAGMAAEVYADTPEQLERVLGFVPPHPHLPTVHLSRASTCCTERAGTSWRTFATRFAGRVWGLVVHDKAEMAAQDRRTRARPARARRPPPGGPGPAVRAPGVRGGAATGLVRRGRRTGRRPRADQLLHRRRPRRHQAGARPASRAAQPGRDLAALRLGDPRLPELAATVQSAVATALPDRAGADPAGWGRSASRSTSTCTTATR